MDPCALRVLASLCGYYEPAQGQRLRLCSDARYLLSGSEKSVCERTQTKLGSLSKYGVWAYPTHVSLAPLKLTVDLFSVQRMIIDSFCSKFRTTDSRDRSVVSENAKSSGQHTHTNSMTLKIFTHVAVPYEMRVYYMSSHGIC